jgi:hypothetical protein
MNPFEVVKMAQCGINEGLRDNAWRSAEKYLIENNTIEGTIILGVGYAMAQNWNVVDCLIVQDYKERLQRGGANDPTFERRIGLPIELLRNSNGYVRDYAATLADVLMNNEVPNTQSHMELLRELTRVSKEDENVFARMYSSFALISARGYVALEQWNPELHAENLQRAAAEDPSLTQRVTEALASLKQ